MIGSLKVLLLISVVACVAHSACTVKEIKNVVTNQFLFAGNVSTSTSPDSQLFFLFYGRNQVTDRSELNTHPTLVVFGKYLLHY